MDPLHKALGVTVAIIYTCIINCEELNRSSPMVLTAVSTVPCGSLNGHHCSLGVSVCVSFQSWGETLNKTTGVILSYEYKDSRHKDDILQFNLAHNEARLWMQNTNITALFDLDTVLNEHFSSNRLCIADSSPDDVNTDVTVILNDRSQSLAFPNQAPRSVQSADAQASNETNMNVKIQVYFRGESSDEYDQTHGTPYLISCLEDLSFEILSAQRVPYRLKWTINSNSDSHLSSPPCEQVCYTNTSCSLTPEDCMGPSIEKGQPDCGECFGLTSTTMLRGCHSKTVIDFLLEHWMILTTFLTLTLLMVVICLCCTVSCKKSRSTTKQGQELSVIKRGSIDSSKPRTADSRLPSSLSGSIEMEWDPQLENRVKTPELEWDHKAHDPDV